VDPGPATAVMEAGYRALRPTWDADTEQTIFGLLLDVFRNQKGAELGARAIVLTVAEAIADPDALVYEILDYDPDYPVYRFDDVVGYSHHVPELEALMRHAMVLHNEFPWSREDTRLTAVSALRGACEVRPPSWGVRRAALLLVHAHATDAVGCDLALRPTRHVPDPRVLRPRRRLRRFRLCSRRGGPPAR